MNRMDYPKAMYVDNAGRRDTGIADMELVRWIEVM